MNKKVIMMLVATSLALVSQQCHRPADIPKPYAYLRIDMPEATYHRCDTAAVPFTFEKNDLAEVTIKKHTHRDVWIDLTYPQFDGIVFLSYKHLHGLDDLRGQTDTSSRLLENHYQFASGVEEAAYENPAQHVYGTTYQLHGKRVASTFQFWATDSLHHFLRGSLYINRTPNNDSLSPVLDYIREDLTHLIETLEWR